MKTAKIRQDVKSVWIIFSEKENWYSSTNLRPSLLISRVGYKWEIYLLFVHIMHRLYTININSYSYLRNGQYLLERGSAEFSCTNAGLDILVGYSILFLAHVQTFGFEIG